MDWAEAEEKADLERLKAQNAMTQSGKPAIVPEDPMSDPANKEWVEQQLQRELEEAKKLYGDDFGEDIEADFGE